MKKLKRLFSVLLTFALVMSFSVSVFAAEKAPDSALTVNEYKEFLAQESPEDLQKFEALSADEQEKFIDYLLDPATYSGDLVAPGITRATTYDRTEKVASGADLGAARSTRYDAWGTSTVDIMGIEILEYRIEVGYSVSGSTITTIYYNDAFVVKNLNPLVQTDTTSKSAYISGNVVHAKGTFYYKLGPIEGLSVQIGNIYGELLAYSDGDTSISYWRD